MAISGINPNAAAATAKSSTTNQTKNSSSLSMDDFFTLLSAQMQNQTMFNPMQDTEFIGQMAQFSSLQQMQALTSSFAASMAASFIGKYVTAAEVDDAGQTVVSKGLVEKVDFTGDSPMLLVDGNWFTTSGIIDVQNQAPVVETVAEIAADTAADTTSASATDSAVTDGSNIAADPAE